jgi:hypothetical protein
MFNVRFDFNYEISKWTRRRKLHFTEQNRQKITSSCRELSKYSKLVITPSKLRSRIIDEYFGAVYQNQVHNHLKLLNNVINNSTKTVTFVDGSPRRVRVKVDPHNLDAPQTIMKKPYSKKVMERAGAWVHTLPGKGTARKPGEYHIGSGYRIILGKAFDHSDPVFYNMGVIYHELTHKILGTNDHCYGERNSKSLKGTARAIKNADNYNFFLQKFAEDYSKGLRV